MKLLIAAICAGDVLAGGDDLELLQLRGDVGLRGIGLRRLDHLDAPGVGDVAVGERDAVRALLRRVLEELRVARPGREALRIGVGRRDDLRRRSIGKACGRDQGDRSGDTSAMWHRSLLRVGKARLPLQQAVTSNGRRGRTRGCGAGRARASIQSAAQTHNRVARDRGHVGEADRGRCVPAQHANRRRRSARSRS